MSLTNRSSTFDLQPSRLHQVIQGILLASVLTVSVAANAESTNNTGSVKRSYHISGGSLSQALRQFATNSGLLFSAEAKLTDGKTSAGLDGEYTVEEGFKKLLAGTGLTYTITEDNLVAIKIAENGSSAVTLPTVKVTGQTVYDPDSHFNQDYIRQYANATTRTDTPLMDTPASIQVVPQQILKDQQAVRLEDAVKNVSGVQAVWTSGGQGHDFVIRGFGTNYSRFRNGQRIASFSTDMANVEQVDVLKGPGAMLFGRVEPGGMVNVVTKKPLADAYYSLQQQFGSYDFYRTVADATGPLLDDKSLSYRLNFVYTDSNSFRDFVSLNQKFFAPSLHWQATDKTEFNLAVEYTDRKLPYDTGIPAIAGHGVFNVPISTNYGQPGSQFNQDPANSTLMDFNWSHSFNDNWKLRNGLVANWVNTHLRDILVAVYQPLLTPENNSLQVRRGSEFEDNTDNSYSTYLNITGKFNTGVVKHNSLFGGDYFSDSQKQSGFFGFNAANAPSGSPYAMPSDFGGGSFAFSRVNLNNPVYPNLDFNAYENQRINHPNDFVINKYSWFGMYLQDQLSFFDDKLQVVGGGRYDWTHYGYGISNSADLFSSDVNGNWTGYIPSFSNATQNMNKRNDGFFSPRVGLIYRPESWISIYGNRVEGFGLNTYRSDTSQPLKPETSTQYEAGVKTELLDGKLNTNLAYFHIGKNNVAALIGDGGVFSTIGSARSQGIELDIAGKLTESLSLTTSYAFTDAKITSEFIDSNTGNNDQGHRLPNVAEHSSNTWLKYAFHESELKGLSMGIGAYIAGKRNGDNANSYQLPGYVRVDTFAGYSMKLGSSKLTTQLNVNNIFDKTYFVAGQPYNGLPT